MFYGDNGLGFTADSKEFIEYCIKKGDLKPEEVKAIRLTRNSRFTVIVKMKNGDEFRTSGFNWGYGGEGPRGLLWLMVKLGFVEEEIMEMHMPVIASLNMDMDYLIIKETGKIELTKRGCAVLDALGFNVSVN